MATIEPRLIHLLNEASSNSPHLSNNDLPPLHSLPLNGHSDGPLPPLDRDGRYVSSSTSTYPMRMLLGDSTDDHHYVASARSESPEGSDDQHYKKRSRAPNAKDDFVQLPQPLKKQKATQQSSLHMPPIINGLHEPPPHAALFPPISSESFGNEADARHHYTHRPESHHSSRRSSPESDKSSTKGRKRATKPRRKWSEDETNHLLLGVNRHGVGKWTSILEDPDFTFNERTAGDLKDRFRTCCPEELRSSSKALKASKNKSAKKGIHSENILIDDEELSPPSKSSKGSDGKPKKSRAHRKNLDDLAELGIHGPFKKSHRRERRPFTEQDDREILEGLDQYGPAWTKIQRDSRFHLSSRQPTDLRDRVRNKYPAIYQRIEKGTFQTAGSPRSSSIMEPSVQMAIDNSLHRSNPSALNVAGSRRNSREDLTRWAMHGADSGEYAHHQQHFEFGDGSAANHFMGGEMDISRLLLDDPRGTHASRHGMDSSGPSSPTGMESHSHRRERYESYAMKC